MKVLLLFSLLLSLGAGAATYSKNDGKTAPDTFNSKSNEVIPSSSGKTIRTLKTYEKTTTVKSGDINTKRDQGENQKVDQNKDLIEAQEATE